MFLYDAVQSVKYFNTVHVKFMDILLAGFAMFGENITGALDPEILIFFDTFSTLCRLDFSS